MSDAFCLSIMLEYILSRLSRMDVRIWRWLPDLERCYWSMSLEDSKLMYQPCAYPSEFSSQYVVERMV